MTTALSRRVLVPTESIDRAIVLIGGQRVILDTDLATMYRVDVKLLNQAVKRNAERFPADFMMRLTASQADSLRSQTVTLKSGRGRHRKYLPHAFTEQGVAMLSSVLRSPRAVQVNIAIMRAFVHLRRTLGAHAELARKLDALEAKYDDQFTVVFRAIRRLVAPAPRPVRPIGFRRTGGVASGAGRPRSRRANPIAAVAGRPLAGRRRD